VGVGVELGVGVTVGVGVGVGGGPDCAQYFPPLLESVDDPSMPPHTIISLPVQTALCVCRRVGAPIVLVTVQLSMPGLYLPPVFTKLEVSSCPPQTIISLPDHTAVCRARAN
jgi:hypothetical protein